MTAADAAAAPAPTFVPHSLQNGILGSMAAPHLEHRAAVLASAGDAIAVPQLVQNRAVSGFLLPHLEQDHMMPPPGRSISQDC
jgi:hypothetical protein